MSNEAGELIGLAKLMRMAYAGDDLGPIGQALLQRANDAAGEPDANALLDLSTVLQLRGDHDLALQVQREALALRQVYTAPTGDAPKRLRVLAMMGPGDLMVNTPLEFMFEDSDVQLQLLFVAPGLALPDTLPEHDVLFVAIGESDQNQLLLDAVDEAVKAWPRGVVNQPDRIAALSRDRVSHLLAGVEGVYTPETVRVTRHALAQIGEGSLALTEALGGAAFPVIVRPVDSHAGRGLAKVDDPAGLRAYLGGHPDDAFYVAQFVDYRGADGLFRKYRIALIDGRPFLCHLAISSHWMIHYLNAGMEESAEKRAEEARCMADFDTTFARRHAEALRAIHHLSGLDFVGVDCGETRDGRLLVFEVDSNMIMHAIDPPEMFPYKPPQMRRVFAALRALVGARAAAS